MLEDGVPWAGHQDRDRLRLVSQRERAAQPCNPPRPASPRRRGVVHWHNADPLVHGATYFAELLRCIGELRRGDLLLFTDWRGDPDQLLTGDPDSTVSQALCEAARRGVDVRGLIWRSHLDKLGLSASENRHLGEEIEQPAASACWTCGSAPARTTRSSWCCAIPAARSSTSRSSAASTSATAGGTTPSTAATRNRSRWPRSTARDRRGTTPWWPCADPVVGDVETVFRERWEDPQPLTRSPLNWLSERARREDRHGDPLPPQLPDPAPVGSHAVQLLRTYPKRLGGYPFAPDGERSVAHGYTKALRRARCLVYVEDQYLWSNEVASTFADALRAQPGLHVVAVLPHHPDQDGRFSLPPNLVGRDRAMSTMREAGGDRVAIYGIENASGTPVYVHAKICIVDDTWATIGSDNFNRRSWTHDSELTAAVLDDTRDPRTPRDPGGLGDGARTYARELRLQLIREHLDRRDDDGLVDPLEAFHELRRSATALQAWYDDDRVGPRPPGQLRPLVDPALPTTTKRWATQAYHRLYDPDGRPRHAAPTPVLTVL